MEEGEEQNEVEEQPAEADVSEEPAQPGPAAAVEEKQPEPEPQPEQNAEQNAEQKPEPEKTVARQSSQQKEAREPPNEKIFLLEFVVDSLHLDFCVNKRLKDVDGQFCVSYSFLDNGPFDVCEEDFGSKRSYSDDSTAASATKNGRSCLFALTEKQVNEVKNLFILDVQVSKQKPTDVIKRFVAQTTVRLSQLFQALMKEVEKGQSTICSKVLKDCFKLNNRTNSEVLGHLSAYVRLSCFGKMVVNQFQMNVKEMYVDVKANKGYYSYKFSSRTISPQTDYGFKDFPGQCQQQQGGFEHPQVQPVQYPVAPLPASLPTPGRYVPPCQQGLMPCMTPLCCHPPTNAPYPECVPPPCNTPSCGPLGPCMMRTTPCCTLPCHYLPKTRPSQQRVKDTQTDATIRG